MTVATARTTSRASVRAFRADEGCQAHLVIDRTTGGALVIDPRLDQVDEIIEAARSEGAEILFAVDTHTHADHLSGVRLVAQRTGARILAHPDSKAEADATLGAQTVFTLGETPVQIIHSPGHTPDSLSLFVDGHLFTGDALFVGSAGRTDFMGGSASDLYDTFRKFEELPDETVVHPGHDYIGQPSTTLGAERRENPLMRERDRSALVERMKVRAPLPRNMKEILRFNTRPPSGELVSALELAALRNLADGPRLIDIRSRSEFGNNRIDGATNIPIDELEARIAEIPARGDVVLVCRSGIRSQEAARVLKKLGREARQLDGGIAAWSQLGLPTVGRGGMSVERQAQLTIGTVVFTGTLFSALVSPLFLVVPAFFGAGLVFAGLSGTCTLAYLIGRMPWNRHPEEDTAACSATTRAACSAGTAPAAGDS